MMVTSQEFRGLKISRIFGKMFNFTEISNRNWSESTIAFFISVYIFNLLQMMIIMCFRRRHEGKMISRMLNHWENNLDINPEDKCRKMTACQCRSQQTRHHVSENELHRMAVDGSWGNRGLPFVVNFMNVFVQRFVMQNSETNSNLLQFLLGSPCHHCSVSVDSINLQRVNILMNAIY